MDYILLIVAVVLLGADFSCNKLYQGSFGASLCSSFLYNSLVGLLSTVVFFILNGFSLSVTPFSLIMVVLMTVCAVSYKLIGFGILKCSGSLTQYTLFLMTGGMLPPYIWGVFFLNEYVSPLRIAGLFIIAFGVALPNISKARVSPKLILMCLSVFFLNGAVSIISKMHQVQTVYPSVSATDFVILSNLICFVFAGLLFLILRKKQGFRPVAPIKKALIITAASAIFGGGSYLLQLIGAARLPATVLYPIITGGSIITSAAADWLIFKVKPSKTLVLSICLCFVGTLLFL